MVKNFISFNFENKGLTRIAKAISNFRPNVMKTLFVRQWVKLASSSKLNVDTQTMNCVYITFINGSLFNVKNLVYLIFI